jgi:predicted permease
MIGRLKEEDSLPRVQEALTAAAQQLERAYPADNEGFGRPVRVFSLIGKDFRHVSPEVVLFPAVMVTVLGLILLIACANVAGLLLVRGVSRRREIAIRLAVGAGRWRVIQTLLAESALLSLVGALGGLLLTVWLTALLNTVRLPGMPRAVTFAFELDWTAVAYALALALATTLLCGLTPALQSTKVGLALGVKDFSPSANRRFPLRSGLVVGQVAVSLVLLTTSFLFLRSLLYVGTVQPGFDIDHTLTAKVSLEKTRYTREQGYLFFEQAMDRLANVPGVESVSVAYPSPLGGDAIRHLVEVEDGPEAPRTPAYVSFVGRRYFETLRIPVLQGREFGPGDDERAQPAAIVNETLARKLFPGGNAVGKSLLHRVQTATSRQIVGVVADTKYAMLGEDPRPILFLPYQQGFGAHILHIRTSLPPQQMLAGVQQAIAESDKSIRVEADTMRENMKFAFLPYRIGALLFGAIGALGLSLSIIGLVGVVAHSVRRRTKEIAVRMALGATGPEVRRLVVREGLLLVGLGVGIGAAVAAVVTRPLGSLVAGVSPTDPGTFVAVVVILTGVACIAAYIPARRAAKVDPMTALRYE